MYQKPLKEFAKIVAQSKSMPTREESLNFYHVHLVGPEMRWSKKAIWSGWKGTPISCLYSISLWDDCPHNNDYSEKYPSLSTVPGRGSIYFCFSSKFVLRTSHYFQELVTSWCLWKYFPIEAEWIRPWCRGTRKFIWNSPPTMECLYTYFFFRSTNSYVVLVLLGDVKSNDLFFEQKNPSTKWSYISTLWVFPKIMVPPNHLF